MPNDRSYIWEGMAMRERESPETRCVELVVYVSVSGRGRDSAAA